MRNARIWWIVPMLCALLMLLGASKFSRELVGFDLGQFDGREVLIFRTSEPVNLPSGFAPNVEALQVTFTLLRTHNGLASELEIPGELIKAVNLESSSDGLRLTVTLATSEQISERLFRLSQPSEHVVMFEAFPPDTEDAQLTRLVKPDELSQIREVAGRIETTPQQPASAAPPSFDPDAAGIPVIDLRGADPQRVLSLAANTGLLDLTGVAQVESENLGSLTITPTGMSLASWAGATPPGELYITGPPAKLAAFMSLADPATINQLPSLEAIWASKRPESKPATTKLGGAGRSYGTPTGTLNDPIAGIYMEDSMPETQRSFLSDIYVTLPAMNGLNLYDVINYLSSISGISIILDPYTFDEPVGGIRPPKVPDGPQGGENEPGFRPADEFQADMPRSGGTVMGNFVNVPFDQALKIILGTHNLEFIVYENSKERRGDRYGQPDSSKRSGDPYAKPVVMVTSKERVEQELPGQNQVDLYQFHYADPGQVTDLLDNLGMLPGTNSGWYIYDGGTGGGSGGLGGGSGGSSRGSGGSRMGTTTPGFIAYRGSTRAPVQQVVADAMANGDSVVRVILAPEQGQLVTAFVR